MWGCESPELLLTEVLAFHDRRVKDTPTANSRNTPMTPDPDLDQVRVPEGSVFFELLCTHNGNKSVQAKASGDLYDNSGVQPRLRLGQIAPAGAGGYQYPVWRIATTGSTMNATTGPNNNVAGPHW